MRVFGGDTMRQVLGRITGGFVLLWVYVLLHEGGHAVVALLGGAELTRFSVHLFDARMRYAGILRKGCEPWLHAAGFALPYLVWLALQGMRTRPPGHALTRLRAMTLPVAATALPWVVIPVLAVFGHAPAGDDVTRFLASTRLSTSFVSLSALALLVASLRLWRMRVGRSLPALLRDARSHVPSRRTLALLLFLLGFGLWLMGSPWSQAIEQPVPPGYVLLCEADLGGLDGDGWELCAFDLDQPARVGIRVQSDEVRSGPMRLSLRAQDGTQWPLISADAYRGPLVLETKRELDAGRYRFMLDSRSSEGRLRIFLEMP